MTMIPGILLHFWHMHNRWVDVMTILTEPTCDVHETDQLFRPLITVSRYISVPHCESAEDQEIASVRGPTDAQSRQPPFTYYPSAPEPA